MSRLSNTSIKRKLYLIIMGTVTAALLLNLVASTAVLIAVARDAVGEHLQALAAIVAGNSAAVIAFQDQEAGSEVLNTLVSQPDVLEAIIRTPDDKIFARYRAPRAVDAEISISNQLLDLWLSDTLHITQPVVFDDAMIGQVYITGDLSHARTLVAWQASMGIAVFLLSLVLALLLSTRLQRIVSEPVQRLLATMADVARTHNFSRRAQRSGDDELGELADGFNLMLTEIERSNQVLASYREDLEQQVEQRTAELAGATQQAMAASEAKSQFLATMSHEIRTPMTSVIGFAELLRQTQLNDQQRDYVDVIGSSSESLLGIIDEILDFSKMEAGRTQIDSVDFEVDGLLDGVRRTLMAKAREKELELSVYRDDGVPSRLHGDPLRLRQILLNLAGNALKFTDRGGVEIQVAAVARDDGRFGLEIAVRDTGIGITPEQQQHLFEPFQQGDSAITRRFGGTGLGLVIAQRLAHLMDGEIAFESTPGRGSTFTARLLLDHIDEAAATQPGAAGPAQEAPDRDTAAPAAPGTDGRPLRVMVVDDSSVNLQLAATLLERHDMDVFALQNAAEALDILALEPVDLIFMDLEMPDTDGIAASRAIRAGGGPNAAVPIVALTAHGIPEKRQQVFAAGIDDILAKPYLPDDLYAMIDRWCVADSPPDSTPVWDRETALAVVDHDENAAGSMLTEFMRVLPENEAQLHQTHAAADYDALAQAAHKLSGATTVVGAQALGEASVELQQQLRQNPPTQAGIDVAFAKTLREIQRFREAVDGSTTAAPQGPNPPPGSARPD